MGIKKEFVFLGWPVGTPIKCTYCSNIGTLSYNRGDCTIKADIGPCKIYQKNGVSKNEPSKCR